MDLHAEGRCRKYCEAHRDVRLDFGVQDVPSEALASFE